MIFQEETGTQLGTSHFQGYTEFKKQSRIGKNKRILSERCHIERRKGTQKQAIDYCRKTDTRLQGGLFVEKGIPKKYMKDKVENVIIELHKGKKPEDIREEFPKTYLLKKKKILDYYIEGLHQQLQDASLLDWEASLLVMLS